MHTHLKTEKKGGGEIDENSGHYCLRHLEARVMPQICPKYTLKVPEIMSEGSPRYT